MNGPFFGRALFIGTGRTRSRARARKREEPRLAGFSGCGMVPSTGFEPATSCSGGRRSIQLSYEGTMEAIIRKTAHDESGKRLWVRRHRKRCR